MGYSVKDFTEVQINYIILNLHFLERKARGDMIEVFKWVKGINKGNINKVLEISIQDRTRGNGYKLENLDSGQT